MWGKDFKLFVIQWKYKNNKNNKNNIFDLSYIFDFLFLKTIYIVLHINVLVIQFAD